MTAPGNLLRIGFALALIASSALTGARALAVPADPPARLLVEIEKDSRSIAPGAQILVQVVGESAAGDRVSFPGKTAELTASKGKVEVIERPYKFRYTAPDKLDRSIEVTLTAQLEGYPEIKGSATVDVVVPGDASGSAAFKRLILRTDDTQVPLGGSIAIEVLGDTGSGAASRVSNEDTTLIAVGHSDPAGKIESDKRALFRYTAPARGGAYAVGDTVRLVAALARDGNVTGELTVTLVRGGGGKPERPDGWIPPRPSGDKGNPPKGDDDGDDGGVLLPSKNLRVVIWRTKDTAEETFKNERTLPKDGSSFVAPSPFHKLRFVVERDDVIAVSLTWFVGEKKGASVHTLKPAKDGPLKANRNKQGKLAIHVELETPEAKKAIQAELLLELDSGKTLREPFSLERGVDKDKDGDRDGPR
jgi:hypothetical protein